MKNSKSNLLRWLVQLLNEEIQTAGTDNKKEPEHNQYNRRKFLTRTAKGAAGISLAASMPALMQACKSRTNNKKDKKAPPAKTDMLDIAILGGGIAGLNCANHLLQTSLNFKIFEASKRVGGRILTHYNDLVGLEVYPEFGGDFIDSGHADMLALAKEFNLELLDLEEEQKSKNLSKDIYFFDNRKISEKEIIKEFKKIAGKIAADKAALGENYDTEEAIRLDKLPLSDYFNSLKCANWLKELFVAAFIAEYGLDCNEQSTLNFLDMIETSTEAGFKVFGDSDERYRIVGGNSKIIEGLVKKIGNERIEKNHTVQKVNENDDGTYKIIFDNNTEVQARKIVCTIPFTILRGLKLNLKNMSPEKRKCIDELGYGMNTKLVLSYHGTPWSEKPNNAMGYLFHKDIVNGWDSSYNKAGHTDKGAYVGYFGGTYSVKLSEQSFKNKMAPPTHVWRTELPQATVNGLVSELDKVFVGSKKKFLDKHIFVNWIDFPYVKGSYSCYKPGQWTSISGKEMEPVGNFFFAGEHCSSEFQGFMNGAAETGRRVAETILAAVNQNS